jgi:hypothetical protein
MVVRSSNLLHTVLVLLLAACGAVENGQHAAGFPDVKARRGAASDVREIAASSRDASFTAIDALDVDSKGLIYVPDTYQQRMTVLGPDARVVRSFGRRGSGPGEFRSIRGVQILDGDSVLAYDPTLGRITVFAPGTDQPAYSVTVGPKLSGESPFDLRRTHDNLGYLALFRPEFAFVAGARFDARRDRVRRLGLDGGPLAELLTFPSKAFLVAENSIMPHPFGNEGFARLDSADRLIFVRSDSLGAAFFDPSGSRLGGFSIPHAAPAVTSDDRDAAVAAIPAQVRGRFTPVLTDSLPDRWPAVRDVIVDDRNRIWMAIGGSLREPTEWAAFSQDGAYLGSMLVPSGSDVRLIRGNGRVYASRSDEDDVPHVVIYQMARPLR